MNLVEVPLSGDGVQIGSSTILLPRDVISAASSQGPQVRVIFGFRPEDTRDDRWRGVPVVVDVVESMGSDAYVYGRVQVPGGADEQVVIRTDGRVPPKIGDTIHPVITEEHMHVFSPVTEERIEA